MDQPTQITSIIAVTAVMGTVLGVVMRGWTTVRASFAYMSSYVVCDDALDDEETSQIVLAYLIKHYPRSRFGNRYFGGKFENFRNGTYGHVPFESFGRKSLVFWSGRFPIWYKVVIDDKKENDKGSVIYWGEKPKAPARANIVSIRGTCKIEEIIRKASEARNEKVRGETASRRFFIKKVPDANMQGREKHSANTQLEWFHQGVSQLLMHDPDDLGRKNPTPGKVLDGMYFPDHVTDMIDELRHWRDSRDWYHERGIPWKRGWLLYGRPGCGKTGLIRGVSEDLDLPLFVFSLGELQNEELERSWYAMQAHTPCIALFEDFDNVFNGRENIFGKPKLSDMIGAGNGPNLVASETTMPQTGRLSFDCLLNCIDGADKTGGIFTVITTNHLDTIDPALGKPRKKLDGSVEFISTRPGRIDRAIELGFMDKKGKKHLARRILFDDREALDIMLKMIDQDELEETPAQFQERCAQFALHSFWEKKKRTRSRSNGHVKVSCAS